MSHVIALHSFKRAVGTVAGSPVLLAGGVATAAIVAPQTVLSYVGNFGGAPLGGLSGVVASVLSVLTFFITPLVVAGTLGMAREALDEGRTSLDTFTGVARDRYVPLLLGFLLRVGLTVVLGLAAAVVGFLGLLALLFVVGVSAGAGGSLSPGALLDGVGVAAFAVLALTLVVAALVFYLPLFFLQFFHVSVVTERAGAVEGFTRSYRAVRQNLLSSLGFSALNIAVSVLPSVPLFAWVGLEAWERIQRGTLVQTTAETTTLLSTTEVLALTGVVVLAQVVLVPVQHTFATAFYGAASEPRESGADEGPTSDDGPVQAADIDTGTMPGEADVTPAPPPDAEPESDARLMISVRAGTALDPRKDP